MTDKAPERIWATYSDAFGYPMWETSSYTTEPQPEEGRYVAFVREDTHKAEMAAMLEEAAQECDEAADRFTDAIVTHYIRVIGKNIRALTPDDAKAALSAQMEAAWREGWEAVLAERERVLAIVRSPMLPFSLGGDLLLDSQTCEAIETAIRKGGEDE